MAKEQCWSGSHCHSGGVGGKKGARMVQDPMQGGRGLVKPHQMID